MIENFEQLLALISEKRNSKHLTTKEISKQTRINQEYLDAIESNAIDKLPLGYEKIFVRSYLKYLGLDSDEHMKIVTEHFDEDEKQQQVVTTNQKTEPISFDVSQFKAVVVWAPIILVIIFLIYIVYSNFEHKTALPVKELTVEEGLATVDTVTYEKPDTLQVTIRSLGDVFIFVKIDSVEQFSRTMAKDQEWRLRALKEINIYANFADRIQVNFFNTDLGVIGQQGQRLSYLVIGPDGIKRKGLTQIKTAAEGEQ